MGVPYNDAWGMPVDMALDMLGISPYVTKSKQPDAHHHPNNPKPLPDTLVNHTKPPTNSAANSVVTGTRKLVAARRKSKLQSNPTK